MTDEEGERSLVFSAVTLGTPALSSCGAAEAKTRRIGLIELWLSVGRSGEAAVWRRGVNSVVGSAEEGKNANSDDVQMMVAEGISVAGSRLEEIWSDALFFFLHFNSRFGDQFQREGRRGEEK